MNYFTKTIVGRPEAFEIATVTWPGRQGSESTCTAVTWPGRRGSKSTCTRDTWQHPKSQ
jgi:hypothetical protein